MHWLATVPVTVKTTRAKAGHVIASKNLPVRIPTGPNGDGNVMLRCVVTVDCVCCAWLLAVLYLRLT